GLMAAARQLAVRAVEQRLDLLAPCPAPEEATDCAARFVTDLGKRAFRRPLEAAEQESLLRLYHKRAPTLGYGAAIGLLIETLLQSPQFLYRVEAPLTAVDDPSRRSVPLGPYEIASRLSYFLWGSLPDDELFAAA